MARRGNHRLLAAIGLIGGLATLVYGGVQVARAYASTGWSTAAGEVVVCQVVRGSSGTGTSRSSSYRAEVRYAYTVDGTAHEGDRISFRRIGGKTQDHARRIAGQYPVGRAVAVRYDPDDPAVSVLEPGAGWETYLIVAFGVALLAVGVVSGRRALAA